MTHERALRLSSLTTTSFRPVTASGRTQRWIQASKRYCAYGAALLVTAVLQPLRRVLAAAVEEATVGEVDRRLMDVGTRLVDLHRIEQPSFHDELEQLRHHVQSIPRSIQLLDRGVSAPLTLLGVLALLAHISPVLPVALGSVTVAHVLSEARMSRLRHEAMLRRSQAAREMDYCARLTTEAAGAKEVRVFGLGQVLLTRYRERAAAAVGEMRGARLAQLRSTGALAGLHAAVVAFGFVYVARRAEAGGLGPGDVALYLSAVLEAEVSSWGLSFLFSYGHFTVLNLRVAMPFLDEARPAIALAPPGEGRPAPASLSTGIEFDRVDFAYPARHCSRPCRVQRGPDGGEGHRRGGGQRSGQVHAGEPAHPHVRPHGRGGGGRRL